MTAGNSTTHDDQTEVRATREVKRLLAAACERMVLYERDTERVLALLENPPEPTPALLAAARRRFGAP